MLVYNFKKVTKAKSFLYYIRRWSFILLEHLMCHILPKRGLISKGV